MEITAPEPGVAQPENPGPARKLSLRIGLVAALLYLAVALPALTRYPLVFEDEVTLNEPAKELALYGHWRSEYFSASHRESDFDRHYFWQPPGQALVTAGSYTLFGFGSWQTRLPGVLAAAASLAVVAVLAGRIAGPWAAAFAAALLALHPQFFRSSINARMDTLCWLGLLGGFGILLFRARHIRGFSAYATAGLCVGLAGIMHPLAVFWAAALNLVLIFRRAGWANWVAFNFACALPPLGWLAWAWPDRATWAAQFLHHGASRTATGSVWTRVTEEIARNLESHAPAPLYLVVIVAGIWLVLPRLRRVDDGLRDAALVAVTMLVLVTLLMGKVMGEYNAYYFIPALLLASAGLARIPEFSRPGRSLALVLLGLAGLWSVARLAGPLLVARTVQAEARNYVPVASGIGRHVNPGEIVWGVPEAWYAVVQAGARLREPVGRPDPAVHAVVILPPDRRGEVPAGYERVAQVGQAIPRFRGRTFSANDYQLEVWRVRPAR